MSLIVTPTQLTQRAELYHQLGQLTAAGIGLPQAVDTQSHNPPSPSFREPLARIHHRLLDGATFTEALRSVGSWLPSFDVALLQAGEQSGRLPGCFKLLAGYYRERAHLARSVIGYLIYPMSIFHLAVLVFPVTRLQQLVLQGNVLGYALQKLVVLAPLYGLVFAGAYAFQGQRGEPWRAIVEAALHRVPVLGPARRSLALARLAVALETLLGAGVAVIEAWELAASASGSPALLRVVREAKPRLYNGEMPSEMVSRSPEFIAPFANLYATGEVSGQLEDSLQRLNVLFQEEGSRKLKTFLTFSAGAIIFGVMLLIAWQVISFWLGYFQQIQQAIPQ